jgi:hypothetical protein
MQTVASDNFERTLMTQAVFAAPPVKQASKPKTSLTSVSKAMAALVGKEDPSAELASLLVPLRAVVVSSETNLIASTRANYDAIDKTIYEAFHFIQSQADKNVRKRLEKGVKDALVASGIRFHEKGSLALKVTKLVTGEGRDKMSRQSLYAQGMVRAYYNGIRPGSLAEYLLENGGWAGKRDFVSAVVKERDNLDAEDSTDAAKKAWQAKVDRARAAVSERDEGSFPVGVGKLFSAENNDKLVLLIGTFKATGEFVVRGAVPHDNAAVDTACTAWANLNK